MDLNIFRRVEWLWRQHHPLHGDADTLLSQIKIIRQTVESQSDGIAGAGSGAFVHLSRDATQSIDAAGELIAWDTQNPVIPRFEFRLTDSAGASLLPLTEIPIPKVGYYDVRVLGLEWVSFTGGGTVRVVRNPSAENETVWPPDDSWTATTGQTGKGTAPAIPFLAGDTVGVFLAPDDASAQDLASAILVVDLVDRTTRSVFYHQVVLADGPVAYWRLDEVSGTTAADASPNGHDGTYVGSPTLGEPGVMSDGSGSTSAEFNGSTQWVTVPVAAVVGLTDLTVEAWINVDSATRFGIFNVNDAGAADAGRNRWGFWVTAAGNLQYSDDASNNTDSTGTIAVGARQYVAFTRTAAGAIVFYIDGVAAGTGTVTVTSAEAGDTVQIGMDIDQAGNSDFFDGHVDEVAVYGRVLTADEVEEHARVGGV